MNIHRSRTLAFIAVALLAVTGVTHVGTAADEAQGATNMSIVDPVFVSGNPSCTDLGYDFGHKPQPEPPPTGTYTFPLTGETVSIVSDGIYFDWTSTLGVDAVIVKGGPNAHLYAYDPPAESFGDTDLHSPISPNNQTPYAISHIEFCYDFELTVSKGATTTFTRTYEWDIAKSVTPSDWHLFTGDTGTSEYTVAVTRTGDTDSDWAVSGSILVENNTPFAATVDGVTDVVSPDIVAAVDCGVAFPTTLPVGGSLVCTYDSDLPDGTTRVNEATVTTAPDGIVRGGGGTADVVFGEPTTEVNATVHVNDTNGESFVFNGTARVTYGRLFDCDDAGKNGNTATIVETGQSAAASVTVTCYELDVEKTAETAYHRYWNWTIEKSADQSELTVSPGQLVFVDYQVDLDATFVDDDHVVRGEISIHNPHPTRSADLTDVSDLVSPDIPATVTCFSSSVPAGGSVTCAYEASLPDGAERTNTATAKLQNYAFSPDGTATPTGTTDFRSDPEPVVFGDTPTDEIDECIEATDTNLDGVIVTLCASDAPTMFFYTVSFGQHPDADVYLECGATTHVNTATFVTNDRGMTGSSSWTVNATVPCEFGCTLTPGYWKTHSEYGPAPYDDTWALLPDGADTPFFGTGQSYYEILRLPPTGGNAYLILAHAYVAAELNVLNGASIPPEVLDAWTQAGALLVEYEDDVNIPKKNQSDRALAISLATVLDDYNNGLTGPGHCTE